MPVKALSLATAILVAASAARAATPAYTMADVTACSKDAIRLCRGDLSDIVKIEACMRSNIDKLRPACRARFDRMH